MTDILEADTEKLEVNVHSAGLMSHENFGWGNIVQILRDRINLKAVSRKAHLLHDDVTNLIPDLIKIQHDIEGTSVKLKDVHKKTIIVFQKGYNTTWSVLMILKHFLTSIAAAVKELPKGEDELTKVINNKILPEFKKDLKKVQKINLAVDSEGRGGQAVALALTRQFVSQKGYYWTYFSLRLSEKKAFKDSGKVDADLKKAITAIAKHQDQKHVHSAAKSLLIHSHDLLNNYLSFVKRLYVIFEDVILDMFRLIGIVNKASGQLDIPPALAENEKSKDFKVLAAGLHAFHNVNMMLNQLGKLETITEAEIKKKSK